MIERTAASWKTPDQKDLLPSKMRKAIDKQIHGVVAKTDTKSRHIAPCGFRKSIGCFPGTVIRIDDRTTCLASCHALTSEAFPVF
jgi:hypothetical protein